MNGWTDRLHTTGGNPWTARQPVCSEAAWPVPEHRRRRDSSGETDRDFHIVAACFHYIHGPAPWSQIFAADLVPCLPQHSFSPGSFGTHRPTAALSLALTDCPLSFLDPAPSDPNADCSCPNNFDGGTDDNKLHMQ